VSDYDRRKEAVEKLAGDLVKHSGMSSEKAKEQAAKVARETDAKKGK
jgi:polyhydroxyalkanoate synthesis regulator phasin